MRRTKDWIIVSAISLMLGHTSLTFCQSSLAPTYSIQILHNSDVVAMVRKGMKADAITDRILRSTCNFDVFPPVLEDLRRRGVPEIVLQLMTVVPNGPPAHILVTEEDKPPTTTVKLPQGLAITVETIYPVSTAKFKAGNSIALVVAQPVYVDGVLVVSRGTVARAKVVKAESARLLGRGGALSWRLDEIRAVDGTKIPVQLSGKAQGNDKNLQMAGGVAATAAVVFPYTAPAAVVWAFQKGDDAVVRGNKRFAAVVGADTEVVGLIPDLDRVFYHTADSIKTITTPSGSTAPTSFPRLGVRN
jgi:hypothetical protein